MIRINDIDSRDSEDIGWVSINKNLQDFSLIPISISSKEIKLNSIVRISNIKSNKEFKIKLVDNPQLKIKHESIQPVFIKAPLAVAMLGKSEGDSFQIELSGEINKVIEIFN